MILLDNKYFLFVVRSASIIDYTFHLRRGKKQRVLM